jgi:hypothetical protein
VGLWPTRLLAPDVKHVLAQAGIGGFLSGAGLWPARFSLRLDKKLDKHSASGGTIDTVFDVVGASFLCAVQG